MLEKKLESLLKQLKKLEKTSIEIRAEGEYPVKARTPVQKVAKWQNDGAILWHGGKIKPSHFVEKAARSKRGWASPIFKSVSKYLDGLEWELETAGLQIAYDINERVDRIKTGRLKKSFRPKVIN